MRRKIVCCTLLSTCPSPGNTNRDMVTVCGIIIIMTSCYINNNYNQLCGDKRCLLHSLVDLFVTGKHDEDTVTCLSLANMIGYGYLFVTGKHDDDTVTVCGLIMIIKRMSN